VIPPKVNNSTAKDLNNSDMGKISNNELRRIIRIISKIKEEMCKLLNEFKETINK
jgi:hypothetical protein